MGLNIIQVEKGMCGDELQVCYGDVNTIGIVL